jgi:hypothetical protein
MRVMHVINYGQYDAMTPKEEPAAAELHEMRCKLAEFAEWLEGRREAPTVTTIGGILWKLEDTFGLVKR